MFHTWEWGDLSECYGHSRYYVAAVDNNRIVGVLPLVHVQSFFFGSHLVSMPFCEYGFPIAEENIHFSTIVNALLEEGKRIAADIRADLIELRGCGQGICEALSAGFRKNEGFLTFELNLKEGEKRIWSQFDKRKRNGIRKAAKLGVRWRQMEDEDDLEDYYALFLRTMTEHGTPPHSFRFFERMWDALARQGWMKAYIAYLDNTPINGIIFFPFNKNILYWSAVSDLEHRDLCAGDLLLWEAIRWGIKNGFEVFDLGRTRKGSGVYLYKKGFNAEEKGLTDLLLSRKKKRLPDPSRPGYRALERIWRMMPISISKRLGPRIRKKITL